MEQIPFRTIDWSIIDKTEHPGATGTSFWQTIQLDGLRIRMVEYTEDYFADHWCLKGHIVHCLEGAFDSELENGATVRLTKGMSYIVSDDQEAHRSRSAGGTRLLIIDGDFLKA